MTSTLTVDFVSPGDTDPALGVFTDILVMASLIPGLVFVDELLPLATEHDATPAGAQP